MKHFPGRPQNANHDDRLEGVSLYLYMDLGVGWDSVNDSVQFKFVRIITDGGKFGG